MRSWCAVIGARPRLKGHFRFARMHHMLPYSRKRSLPSRLAMATRFVGQTMEPGTYKTKPGIKDCYWSRNTGGGDIIDNDFVSFAPDGATVTVYAGEGFESEHYESKTKIG